MSRSSEIVLPFGGEDRVFRLPIGRLRALQEKCDCGPLELLTRFADGRWRVDDLREAIFQGLQGGGMTASDATRLIKSDFDDLPLQQFVLLAQGIVLASVIGAEDESVGELQGEGQQTPPSPAEKSDSAKSMEPPPASVSVRAKPTT